jgi:alkylresorcinol/alkylpyrone synthase
MTTARLASLATLAPAHVIDQKAAMARSAKMFGNRVFSGAMLASVFENTGIKTRRGVMPIEWYTEQHGWPERNAVYLQAAEDLCAQVAQDALDKAGVAAADIGTVVTISSTGIATPSLEARIHGRLGLSPNVRRTPVFGLGCGGGVAGLSLAARLAKADPSKPVLLMVVELCTLSCRPDEMTKANIIATALFGDGAAAAVISADPAAKGRTLDAQGEHLWPETLNIMGWRIDPVGFGVILASSLPDFVTANMPAALAGFLGRNGLSQDDIARFVCHPGGTKVLTALEFCLGADAGTFDHERAVLADYGNMSAPTVLFVLERVLAADPGGRLLAAALGPGFTLHFLCLGDDNA